MVKFGFKLAELETFPGGWVGVRVAGSSENKANLAQLGLELGLCLAICIDVGLSNRQEGHFAGAGYDGDVL